MNLDSCINIVTSYQVAQERVQEFQEEEETAHAVSKLMNRKQQKLSSYRSTESTFETSVVASSVEGNIFSGRNYAQLTGRSATNVAGRDTSVVCAGHTKRLAMLS